MNITDIINAQPNSWIEDFQGIPTQLQERQGKNGPFYTGKLKDPGFPSVMIDATFFRADMMNYAEKVVHFAGQGMKRDEYNGTPKAVVGDKATLQALGNPVADQGQHTSEHTSEHTSVAPQQPQQQAQKSRPSGSPVMGVTVGMAVNNACNLLSANPTLEGTLSIQKKIYNLASDIIRISQTLEKGSLAPKSSERNGQAQPKQAAHPPQPTPPPSAPVQADDPFAVDDEENIQF